jgi:hypothetical protein
MNKTVIAVLLTTVLTAACSAKETVLEANPGQQGAGAKIRLKGGQGTLVAPVLPRWPKGINTVALLTDDYNQITQRFLTVSAEPNMRLMFISIPGNPKAFACDECTSFGLPREWTLKPR